MPDQSNTLSASIQLNDSLLSLNENNQKENIQIVEEDFNARDVNGKPLLHRAVEKKDISLIKRIINGGGDLNITNNVRKTALHTATRFRNFEIIKLLVENGADVNCKDLENITPLFNAVCDSEIYFYLIANGADINSQNDYKETPFDWVIQQNKYKELGLVIKPKIKFHNVVLNEYPFEALEYVSFEFINERDQFNKTALFYALKSTPIRIPVIEKLISLGASLNEVDENGNNLLHQLATTTASAEAFNYILENTNLSIHSLNHFQQTPFRFYRQTFLSSNSLPAFSILKRNPVKACSICDEKSELYTLDSCGHFFCSECLQHYLASDELSTVFLCPHIQCKTPICISDMMALASSETFEKINRRLAEKACSEMEDFKWCSNCNDGGFISTMIKESGQPNQPKRMLFCGFAECHSCSTITCSICSMKIIAGTEAEHKVVCKEHIELEEMSRIAKPCPKCKTFIQHNEGCSHMSCSRCQYQFCYICLGRYKGNFVHNINGPCNC